jgi:hypothetical protein
MLLEWMGFLTVMRLRRPGRHDMRTKGSDVYGFASFPSAEASGAAALDFLERSRDVANEVVVDGTRRETSTLGSEEDSFTRTGPAV